jgi:glycerophosphoryl diester phosphodiesterase
MTVYLWSILIITSCNISSSNMDKTIDIQGHRGCRGLMPENTIPAFIHAIDLGVNTLELDVIATKKGIIYVSHEPFFNHEIATNEGNTEITKENEKKYNMYSMSAEHIMAVDVGMKPHPRFPLQKKIRVNKPRLKEMVEDVEAYTKTKGLANIKYNIEIKREPQNDEVFHPKMEKFADFVCKELKDLGILDRTTVQCFDLETLQYVHQKYPNIDLVYLVMDTNPFEENVNKLGFTPAVYSPYFKLVTEELVNYGNQNSMKIIPWTVNEEEDINLMLDLKVDGIISDYPDKLIEIVESRKIRN